MYKIKRIFAVYGEHGERLICFQADDTDSLGAIAYYGGTAEMHAASTAMLNHLAGRWQVVRDLDQMLHPQ